MASWKEKGVVPDSEDEDEDDDSQPMFNEGYRESLQRESQGIENGRQNAAGDIYKDLDVDQVSADALRVAGVSRLDQSVSQKQSSLSPRVFKKPPPIELQHLPESRRIESQVTSHIDEEISQSYIRVYSPSGSDIQLHAVGNTNDAKTTKCLEPSASRVEENDVAGYMTGDQHEFDYANSIAHSHSLYSTRRSLRQRNPIQLHPYALEGEKYRRTLMARGMRPLRLTQVQDHREFDRAQSPPDPDLGTQNENLSGSLEDETLQPPSCQNSTTSDVPSVPSTNCNTAQSGGEDDEFPDVNQLLDMSHDEFLQPPSKRRKTTYSSRRMSRVSANSSLPRVYKGQSISNRNLKTVHDPPSPPATSSPTRVFHAPFSARGSKQVSISNASSRAVSLEYMGSENVMGQEVLAGNLPTPMTNPVKHTIDLTTEFQSDEDPFASDISSSAVSSSSENEEAAQVQRVGKKIRGVLPASWLRLDQQTRQDGKPRLNARENRSSSPVRIVLSRRGVAIPKDTARETGLDPVESNTDNHFLTSESDNDTEDEPNISTSFEPGPNPLHHGTFSQTDIGSVMEDNRVDHMLPSRKRQTRLTKSVANRRRRPVSNSLFIRRDNGPHHQPKITDHLQIARSSKHGSTKGKRHVIRKNGSSKTTMPGASQRYLQNSVPNLSIVDVVEPYTEDCDRPPMFIRIAARNARLSSKLGRHSPTRKFIRLANREDTQDVQSVLRDWREGILRPCSEIPEIGKTIDARLPLTDISNNARNSSVSVMRNEKDSAKEMPHLLESIQKIVVSKQSQTRPPATTQSQTLSGRRVVSQARQRVPKSLARATIPSAMRPAQLETSMADYRTRHPNLTFGSTKKILDTLYKKARREQKEVREVQQSRFFGNEYSSRRDQPPSIIDGAVEDEQSKISSTASRGLTQPPRRRKQVPKRVDATAVIFRQPSEPLIVESPKHRHGTQEGSWSEGKLKGLGKFGTTYTYHFDVQSLQPGIFFHESTFIGSGRLSKALEISSRSFYDDRGCTKHHVSGKELQWGPWDSTVSSELGMSFDWIIEQLEDFNNIPSQQDGDALIGCITNIIDYVQNSLTFKDLSSRCECLQRITEVSCSFIKQLGALTYRTREEAGTLCVLLELSCQMMVFSFQFLKIAQSNSVEIDLILQLESIVQKSAILTVRLLLSQGLDSVRNLYENLQYLAHRKAGIQCNEVAAQTWVITMHILHAAALPRVSFWDVVNSQLIPEDEARMTDARVLERIWYDMFSLLPLTKFNANGVVARGVNCLGSFENWAIPQRIAKKIFELYKSKSRQSPTFNEYCRALFNRCCFLMQNWGWRRHGIIIGTLFDFFATRKLAHLRNEEVHKSPRFLEELDQNPALTVDVGDRCFHILLKIIAVSIKQMRDGEDTKGVRNLVTRVLPNHDRQYPKEKTVYQRDLASLRNHHDLLCTLFWVSQPDLRPSITLIRELVDPGSSHHEAYLINLRAWENLTRFVLAYDPTPCAYLPFAKWQHESFTQLLAQYKSAEKDIQDQLRELPSAAQKLISVQVVTTTIQDNRNQAIIALALTLEAFKRSIEAISNLDSIMLVAFNENSKACLKAGLGFYQLEFSGILPVVETTLDILLICGDRFIDSKQRSEKRVQSASEDSQEYGSDMFSGLEVETIEFVGHFNGDLLSGVRDILQTSLHSGKMIEHSFRDKIVDVWALMASTLIIARTYDLSDFISDSGALHDLSLDNESQCIRQYASYFLGKVIMHVKDQSLLLTTGRDLLSDWLCILIKPEEQLNSEHELLDHFAMCESVIERGVKNFLIHRRGSKRSMHKLNGLKAGREALLYSTFQAMDTVLRDKPSESNRFQIIVRKLQAHMKSDLMAMIPRLPRTVRHEKFVQSVHLLLFTFFRDLGGIKIANELSTVTYTYSGNSHSYDDSRIFIATLRSYCLRSDTVRGKNELNHYILTVLKYAAAAGNLSAISESLQEAMESERRTWQELSHHLLMVLTPSFIDAAFASQIGWVLVEPFFEVAQEHLLNIADNDREGAIRGVTMIMSSVMNGVKNLMDVHSLDSTRSVTQHGFLYLLLMSTKFLSLVLDWLPLVMEICGKEQEESKRIAPFMAFFYHFACGAKAYLCYPHRWYIKSLERHQALITDATDITDCDDREARINAYEESMENSLRGTFSAVAKLAREQALIDLITPFSRGEEGFNDIKSIFESLYNERSSSGLWLFHDMRNTTFFVNAKSALPNHVVMEPCHLGAIILAEYRQNWVNSVANGGIEIKFGQEKRVATNLTAHKFSSQQLDKMLIIALSDYIDHYERAYGQSSELQILQRNRKRPVGVTENLIF